MMKSRLLSALAVIPLGLATALPKSSSDQATQRTLALPAGTVVGSVVDGVEYYRGIPYAKPPTGSRRLKPPSRLDPFDVVDATGLGPACPQLGATSFPPLFNEVLSEPGVASILLLGSALGNETEDCLTVSVMRPEGTTPEDKLPVLFWMHGGGFDIGSAQPYNASVLIPRAKELNKPFIFVAVNYRLGGFGFLGGRELLADGSTNLGLLDQRMALEWVADNIPAFGGDPDAVTIWGESAGAFSVFDQMALYDGDNAYNDRPLFHAGIMNSGSVLPTERVDGERAQTVFDQVADEAGCSPATHYDPLECLRSVSYEKFRNATAIVPQFLSYNSVALSYTPRPDGKTLTASPDILAQRGRFTQVPVIVGDLEDEGTVFSLFQANITTTDALITYLQDVFFHHATRAEVAALVATYPSRHGAAGSPFGTGQANQAYPTFKRLAAILGDVEYTLTRRVFLEALPPHAPAWSWLATFERGTRYLGTFHTSDLPRAFYGTDDASRAMQDRFIAFVDGLDPNKGVANGAEGYRTVWPRWQKNRELLEFGADSTALRTDDFRSDSFEYIKAHLRQLRY